MVILVFASDEATNIHMKYTYETYSGGGPSTYVYCVVCHCVIAAPYVRRFVLSLHTVTLLKMIHNTLWTMSSLYTSLML